MIDDRLPILYTYIDGTWGVVEPNVIWHDRYSHLLLFGLPGYFESVEVRIEGDKFRVYKLDVVLREIEPLVTRKMSCFFEENNIIEFTMGDLELLLKGMYEHGSDV